MRTFLFIALSITLSVPVFGQDVSLHGVSLGDSFPEAITRLKDRGIDVRSESDDFGYYIRCRVDNRTVTVSASKSDFESLEAAKAQEITSSLSVVDVSSQEVVETYNKQQIQKALERRAWTNLSDKERCNLLLELGNRSN